MIRMRNENEPEWPKKGSAKPIEVNFEPEKHNDIDSLLEYLEQEIIEYVEKNKELVKKLKSLEEDLDVKKKDPEFVKLNRVIGACEACVSFFVSYISFLEKAIEDIQKFPGNQEHIDVFERIIFQCKVDKGETLKLIRDYKKRLEKEEGGKG